MISRPGMENETKDTKQINLPKWEAKAKEATQATLKLVEIREKKKKKS